MRCQSKARARGSLYVAVLGIALLVSVIGLTALSAARVELRGGGADADFAAARLYAQSAVEIGLHLIRGDSDWRSRANGDWFKDLAIGDGTCTLSVVDPADGNLADSNVESVLLTGTGVQGQARYKLQATVTAVQRGLTCLEVALHAGNDVLFSSATMQCLVPATLSANDTVDASASSIACEVQAVNAITGATYTGTRTTGITPRELPDAQAFDYYLTNGTAIVYDTLAQAAPARVIENTLLSPAHNPYGPTTNPQGIYVIDCGGKELRIRNCRIYGTLVVLNPDTASRLEGSVNWEAAVANYPALLVQGPMSFETVSSALTEAVAGMSLNPPGTPYQGSEDTDQLDSYPSKITGLIYVSGDASTTNQVTVDGALVVGVTLSASNFLDPAYRSTYFDNPPPGFLGPVDLEIPSGGWRRAVD